MSSAAVEPLYVDCTSHSSSCQGVHHYHRIPVCYHSHHRQGIHHRCIHLQSHNIPHLQQSEARSDFHRPRMLLNFAGEESRFVREREIFVLGQLSKRLASLSAMIQDCLIHCSVGLVEIHLEGFRHLDLFIVLPLRIQPIQGTA